MSSLGIVVGICAAMGWCGYTMLNNHSAEGLGLFVAAFSPFTLLTVLVDPQLLSGDLFNAENAAGNRMMIFVCTCIAVGIYTAIVWAMYKSMVKNFDMTIRKQSR
jgi:ABC-type Co2+ transport system permease subunit